MKLTKKDFALLNHALDITASDYDPDNKASPEDSPEPYRVKMTKEIDKLRKKLNRLEKAGGIEIYECP